MEYHRKFVVSGIVQGVGFRYHTQDQARRMGLTGWVRNLPGGTVELMACGTRDQLDNLHAWLSQGPPAARVDTVETEEMEPDDSLTGFSIR